MEENLPVAVLGRSERQEVAGTRRFRRPVNDTVWDATSAAEPARDPSGNELAEPRSTHRPGEETYTHKSPPVGHLDGTDSRPLGWDRSPEREPVWETALPEESRTS